MTLVSFKLFYSLAQPWGENASLVGCKTLLNSPDETPEETESDLTGDTSGAEESRPLLVVPDSRGRLRSWHYWKKLPYWRDCVALCSGRTPGEHLEYLKRRDIKTVIAGKDHVDFGQALEELNRRFKVTVVRVDSGGTLNGVLLKAGLADELHLQVHPVLVGGTGQKTFFNDVSSGAGGEISLRFLDAKPQTQGVMLLSYAVSK